MAMVATERTPAAVTPTHTNARADLDMRSQNSGLEVPADRAGLRCEYCGESRSGLQIRESNEPQSSQRNRKDRNLIRLLFFASFASPSRPSRLNALPAFDPHFDR